MTATAVTTQTRIELEQILHVAGMAIAGAGIAASPFIAWWGSAAILASMSITAGLFGHLFVAWLIFTPLVGIFGTLVALLRGIFN